MSQPLLVVQISDLHITLPQTLAYGRVDTGAYLQRAVAAILALDPLPDAVIASGDLTDLGRPAEYVRLASLLAPLPMPVYLMPGNHDDREALRAAFPDHRYFPATGFLDYAVTVGGLRLIALDSVVPRSSAGALRDSQLAWLEATLAQGREQDTLVLLHHPPFATGIRHMDAMALAEPDKLAAVIRRHPQVERVLAGHVHRTIQVRFAGTIGLTCPSTAHAVALDLDSDADPAFTFEPPGLLLHRWHAGEGVASHVVPIGAWPGPFAFKED